MALHVSCQQHSRTEVAVDGFHGKEVECKVLKIDVENRNIVVSRRKLIEEERKASKEKILNEIEVGQLRKGIVKNIADFGVFVDLGGLDGLLHISKMGQGKRIDRVEDLFELGQPVEVKVDDIDPQGKVSLSLAGEAPASSGSGSSSSSSSSSSSLASSCL